MSRRVAARVAVPILVAAAVLALAPSAMAQWTRDGYNALNTRCCTGGIAPNNALLPNLLWNETLDGDVTGTPIVPANGFVYAGTAAGTVYALYRKPRPAGSSQVFKATTVGGPVRGSLLYVNDTIYVPVARPGAPSIVALDPQTFLQKWETVIDTQRDAVVMGGLNYSADQNLVYAGTCACIAEQERRNTSHVGVVAAVDATTGAVIWRTFPALSGGRGGGIAGTPMVHDPFGSVYVATDHQMRGNPPAHPNTDALVALDTATGAIKGSYQAKNDDIAESNSPDPTKRVGFTAGPMASVSRTGGRLLVGAGAGTGTYYAVDAQTMALNFTAPVGAPSSEGGVVGATVYDSTRIIGSSALPGAYWGIDRAGAPKWAFPANDPLRFGPVSSSRNVTWATDSAGFLNAHDNATGRLLSRSPLGRPSIGGVALAFNTAFVAIGTGRDTGGGVAAFN